MRNSTTIRVPQKYRHMISGIYKDSLIGYEVYLEEGYFSAKTGCKTINEKTIKDTLKEIRLIKGGEV